MVTMMARQVVIGKMLYNDENTVNCVVIHPEGDMFLHTNRVEIMSKYGAIEFDVIVNPIVTLGVVALKCYQRKRYYLIVYRSYLVRSCSLQNLLVHYLI